ncbi:hypothetical protein EVAR_529_1 [Eumeta japonica]|uniref:Uncharacterized protein n=1 Tax=Eumeta variegata TaxID=151549 RepID=A0A4C1SDI7_EUMVA|nr:hypothetical protein EVAR_529_1 [Eumeta japonica]
MEYRCAVVAAAVGFCLVSESSGGSLPLSLFHQPVPPLSYHIPCQKASNVLVNPWVANIQGWRAEARVARAARAAVPADPKLRPLHLRAPSLAT